MYESLLLPWATHPSRAETLYRSSNLVKTKGTVYLLPPSSSILRSSFNAPPRPQTRMSSGAVALCKHFERGGASSEHGRVHPFWTLPSGSNEEKTAMAEGVLERMLGEARWRNVMMLHEGVAVYEVRNGKGFGMRWTLELEDVSQISATSGQLGDEPSEFKVEQRGKDISSTPIETTKPVDPESTADEDKVEGWSIKKTTFRGFLEPIAEMDHELDELEN